MRILARSIPRYEIQIHVYRSMIRDSLDNLGYALLPKYGEGSSTEDLTKILTKRHGLSPVSKVHRLVPTSQSESTANTYSGQYGCSEFPLHTDLAHWRRPPRYFLLRCLQGRPDVSTYLLDGNQLIHSLGSGMLERSLVKPRRRIKGDLCLMRLFQPGDSSLLRWDRKYIVPASPAGEIGVDAVNMKLMELPKREVILKNRSDTLLVDNWRMLHGRSSVPSAARDRILERVYMEIDV